MKDNTVIFSEYKVPKAIATLALPSIMGMIINIIYNFADTFFVGQTGDANQVAAVSVSMPLFLLIMAGGNLFGVGGCAFISRSLGEGNKNRVKQISAFCVYSAIALGFVLLALLLIFKKPLLYLIGASDNTIDFACDYLKWIAIGAPFIITGIMAGNLIRGEGAAKDSMIGVVLGQVVNVILDPIFILKTGDKLFGFTMPFGLNQGVAGAAIATVIGNICTVVYFALYFAKGKSMLSLSPKRFTLKKHIVNGVILVGLPASLNNLLMSLSNIIVNMFLIKYGDNAVAAMGVAMKANMLVVMLQLGLGQGIQPLVGYCFGAKKYDRMKKTILYSAIGNIAIGSIMTLLCILLKQDIIKMFIDNKEVVNLGVKMLIALMSPGPIIGVMFVLNFSFQGMGKGFQSLFLSMGRQGLIYVPLLFILNAAIGLNGIIWAQPCADFCCVFAAIIMFIIVMNNLKKEEKKNVEINY